MEANMFTWFGNMKTMAKLMLGFALVGGIMAFVGYTGLTNMGRINDSTDNIYNVQLRPLMTLTKLRGLVHQMRAQTVTAVLTTSPSDREEALARVREFNKQIDESREVFAKTIKAEEVQKGYDDFVKIYGDYLTARDNVILKPLLAGDQTSALAAMKGEVAGRFKASVEAINALADIKMKVAQRKYDDANKVYADSKALLTGIVLGGIGLGLFLGWVIARMIASGLSQVNDVAQKAAEGDLTKRVSIDTKDEIGLMGAAFNQMMDNIARVVGEVRNGSEQVSSASGQISVGTQDLSQRTSEQASALEETSSAMEEMTSTVKQNADNAKQANQLGIAARETAEKGSHVVTQAVTSMEEINKSSKKIADIIGVIDEIAFQTNLLALNAAVEAARAGEQGRGFAVVAAEVRNLAQRSATAAKEIKGLINESVQKVAGGAELVNQCGKSLEEIVTSVKRVTDIVSEMAAASQEQASGIEQVNKAVMQMDETTQQNAALVEESASAAESLQQQSAELLQVVEFFKVSDGREGGLHRGPSQERPAGGAKPVPHAAAHASGSKAAGHASAGKKPAAPKEELVGVGSDRVNGNGNGHKTAHPSVKDAFEEF
ncbi:MAG: methyl-accepting chemotaxis protein [Nitrospirae bacterium]|nr:MAG: methyl-accepting chemotaxis protein [Nitrospirota bacterium]